MKVLYITSLGFRKASSASIRNIGLLNGIAENGHEVDFLTIKYPDSFEDKYLRSKINPNINILTDEINVINSYLNTKKNHSNKKNISKINKYISIIKNIIKSMYFFPDVDKHWIKTYNKDILKKQYDLVISSSDTKTSHFIAKDIIDKKKSCKWYQIWGDPWADDINIKSYSKKKVVKKEKELLRLADKIFYVSQPTTNRMREKYKEISEKIHYLGRSYFETCKGESVGQNKEWIFTYTGVIDENRSILELVEQIILYNENNKKKIKLNIYGYCNETIYNKICDYECIELKGIISFEDILEVYKKSDVLVFIDNGKNTTQIPGKLYDYFGTDRPILALVEDINSDISKFIESTQRCIMKENISKNIDFEFLDSLKKEEILKEYSNDNIAKKIFYIQ